MKFDSIIIVGGGSAGWMSAATLVRFFPDKKITLVESPDHPISGVGESTLAGIRPWMFALGIDEKQFMKYCDASYKQSIKFVDFYKQNDGGFHNPLGHPHYKKEFLGLNDWQLKKYYYPETPNQDYCRTFYSMMPFVENNKIYTGTDLENYKFERDTAYHFDGVKFGLYLRDHYCIPRGVNHIQSTITSIDVGEDGIERIFLDGDARFITADLYIDCSGSKALLLNELEEPFISYNDIIPNNRAWATKIPYKDKEKELEPYTTCTAIGHGWVWNIPLWSRIGTGYVYDDTSISPEKALEDFKQYLGDRSDVEYKDIKMRVGIHERTWVKNVVGIGMAAGFIEPLQSSGLYTVHEFLLKLVRALNRNEYSQWDRDVYNTTTRKMFDRFAHFVALHYTLSLRRDTAYWERIHRTVFDEKMVLQQPSTSQFFDLARRQELVEDHPPVGVHCICTGMDYRMIDPVVVSEWEWNFPQVDKKKMIDNFIVLNNSMRSRWNKLADQSPTVYEYLRTNIYGDN